MKVLLVNHTSAVEWAVWIENRPADSTPCVPVYAMQASASARLRMLPFASTGMPTASRTACIAVYNGSMHMTRWVAAIWQW
jgi:hypothetical protein